MTKLRVNRPRARPSAALRVPAARLRSRTRPSSPETDDGGQVRPSHDRTRPPALAGAGRALDVLERRRVAGCAAPPGPGWPRRRSGRTSRPAGRPWPWPGRRRRRRWPGRRRGRRPARRRPAGRRRRPRPARAARAGPASATTRRQPGSATTARRTTLGICSAPPPRLAQRPETTPPGTYSARNRPSRTQASRHAQPCAVQMRKSSLYSSTGRTAGWSTCAAPRTGCWARRCRPGAKARSTSPGDSGCSVRTPNAAAISAASSPAGAGGPPTADGAPSSSRSSASCTSARHGSPAAPISAATSAPADSAATSSRNRPAGGAPRPSGRAGPRTPVTRSSRVTDGAAAGAANSAPWPSPGRRGGDAAAGRAAPARRAAGPARRPRRAARPSGRRSRAATPRSARRRGSAGPGRRRQQRRVDRERSTARPTAGLADGLPGRHRRGQR